ncbi:dipeptide epimerase [uncultured Desulfobacter sp.]|uniref:mandelate racemase/muconate lactonizing enzyme family protein n=1 Tax=uncultured Desulfobacter sp. TaxID=240139 RepID=UPI002AAB638D|nr:dipeptide epimerase [uncultured Desulfobacter sp.]
MKITKIKIYSARIALTDPVRTALGMEEVCRNLFVKIKTDSGLYGVGEIAHFDAVTGETPDICSAAAKACARLLLGKDPLDIRGNMAGLQRHLAHNTAVKAGFDMAMYDICGKAAGLPVYTLLGGSKRTLTTDRTVGIDIPEKMAQKAKDLVDKGFHKIKVKLGTTIAADLSRIRIIRERVGEEITLLADANQGWDFPTAAAFLKQVRPYHLAYCEQPLASRDFEHMKKLRQKSTIPIAADESVFNAQEAFRLAAGGICDILNIKLSKSGGIFAGEQICDVAESLGLPCMIGCMEETRLCLTAAAHLASARTNIQHIDLDGHFGLEADPVTGGIRYDQDRIILPDTPGLGADLDEAFLAQCDSVCIC